MEGVDVLLDSKIATLISLMDAKSTLMKTTTTADHAAMHVAPTLNARMELVSVSLALMIALRLLDAKPIF